MHWRRGISRGGLVAFVAGFLFMTTVTSAAEPPPEFSRYVTVSVARHSIGGDFTGDRTVSFVKGVFSLPDVDRGGGLAVALGTRTHLAGIEAGYWRSSHDVRMGDIDGEATKQSVGIEARIYGPEFSFIGPFLSTGVFWEWLSVDNGYCSDLTGEQCAERFDGFGVSIGPGVDVQVHERFFVTGRVVYRHTDYDAISSTTADEGSLAYTVDGDGWTWSSGLGFRF